MERLKYKIDVFETSDYELFILDPKNNRGVKTKGARFKVLCASIKKYGLVNPIIVKHNEEGRYVIASGQHRFLACKVLGIPVVYYINDNISVSEIFGADYTQTNPSQRDLVGIGKERGIKIFQLIYGIREKGGFGLSITGIIETVFTFIINNREKIFLNNSFAISCRKDFERSINEYSVAYDFAITQDIYDYLTELQGLANLLEMKSIGNNFNREILKLYLGIGNVRISFKQLLAYLEKETPNIHSNHEYLRKANKETDVRTILLRIEKELLTKEIKKENNKSKVTLVNTHNNEPENQNDEKDNLIEQKDIS